jgi:FlaA1/EpsC-like NDP-sugar epimerase
MNYKVRLIGLIIVDSLVVLLSIYLSHFFLNPFHPSINLMIIISSVTLLLSHQVFSIIYHLYKRAWRYANIDEIVILFKVVVISLCCTAVVQLLAFHDLYERALFLTFLLHLVLLAGVRFFGRYYQLYIERKNDERSLRNRKRTLIIGAGNTGRLVAQHLKMHNKKLVPTVFLDDNPKLRNLEVNGIPVLGPISELKAVAEHYRIKHIIIAIPSLNQNKLNEIINMSKKVCDNVQIIPAIESLALGEIKIDKIRDVSIEDLLGREPVQLDIESIYSKVYNQIVLVTGAGGSIGSEICRQLCKFNPKTMILVDHSEYNMFAIYQELQSIYTNIEYIPKIIDIRNREDIFKIVEHYLPSIVFHAAAYKHVPLMEENPHAAVSVNIIGTKNVADAADYMHVDTFVFISTDKAVNPTSIMGLTKHIAETIVLEKSLVSQTKFVSVRFGNVLGSSGSVVPIFKEQIRQGGPITITHPDMTRYFMTIPEAAQLVIQSASLAKGGEIFILDMGKPVRILDLAKSLIRLSGLDEQEIPIVYTGIRPGEKLHEELFTELEKTNDKIHPKIFVAKPQRNNIDINELIKTYNEMDSLTLKQYLFQIINQEEILEKQEGLLK